MTFLSTLFRDDDVFLQEHFENWLRAIISARHAPAACGAACVRRNWTDGFVTTLTLAALGGRMRPLQHKPFLTESDLAFDLGALVTDFSPERLFPCDPRGGIRILPFVLQNGYGYSQT